MRGHRHFSGDIELETLFAGIAEPPGPTACEPDLHRRKMEPFEIGNRSACRGLQYIPRLRPGEAKDRIAAGDIDEFNPKIPTGFPDALEAPHHFARTDDHQVAVRSVTLHRQVAFDPPARVQDLGVGNPTLGNIHLRGAKLIEECTGIGPLNPDFAEGALIENGRPMAAGVHLAADLFAPGGHPEGQRQMRRLSAEMHHPFPAAPGLEPRARCQQPGMHRRPTLPARGLHRAPRIGVFVVASQHFGDARLQGAKHIHLGAEASDVGLVQFHRWLTGDDPFRHCLARTAGQCDAGGIHAAHQEKSRHPGAFPEHELAVKGKALRPVQQHPHLCPLQGRDAPQCVFHHRHEMIPVLVQQVEAEIGGQTIQRQALGMRFETPDQQSLDIVTGVETPVLVVQRGQMDAGAEGLDLGDGPGQYVEMFAGIQRHVGARHRRHLA